jgi:hypothetical protein
MDLKFELMEVGCVCRALQLLFGSLLTPLFFLVMASRNYWSFGVFLFNWVLNGMFLASPKGPFDCFVLMESKSRPARWE